MNKMNKYEWSNVPKEVKWIATDEDKRVFGYTNMYNNKYIDVAWYGLDAIFLPLEPFKGNWQDSLEERPND